MDWNSPTTKKHIAEAEQQGCVLLGPGRNKDNRTYRLSCGHEQEFDCGAMRKGQISCQICLQEKLSAEAEAAGCEMLGPGKHRAYRIYQLPCGHQQEVVISHIRLKNFRCQICHLKKLTAEATTRSCELLGPGKNFDYRLYQLPCGHKQEINVARVRDGQFWCQSCIAEKQSAEAKSHGCELLGPGKGKDRNIYRLPCGHEQDVQVGNIRIGNFRCQICMLEKLTQEAEAHDCKLLGPGKRANRRIYRLPCGDEQEILTPHMRHGNFRCQVCEEYAYTQPSNVYLLHIKAGADEWLKLGYAKNIDNRINSYGLPLNANVFVLITRPFNTGKDANKFEQTLHKKHRRARLRAKEMANFHAAGGHTECYPVQMVETLIAELKPGQ